MRRREEMGDTNQSQRKDYTLIFNVLTSVHLALTKKLVAGNFQCVVSDKLLHFVSSVGGVHAHLFHWDCK